MRKASISILTLVAFSLFVFFGCKKKETVSVDNETQSVIDNSIADQEFMAIVPVANQHALNTKGTGASYSKMLVPCDTLHFVSGDTSDFIPNPIYTMSVNSTNCSATLPDGKVRTGSLAIRLTGKLKSANSQMIIKMLNYKDSSVSYSCDSIIVTTITSNTLSSTFNIQVINGVCRTSNWTIKYNCNKTITNYAFGNPIGTEAFTSIFGEASGVNRQGRRFSTTISQATPLIKHKTCKFIDKGLLELTPEGYQVRSVDFGEGICDDEAKYTVNGNTVAFKLK